MQPRPPSPDRDDPSPATRPRRTRQRAQADPVNRDAARPCRQRSHEGIDRPRAVRFWLRRRPGVAALIVGLMAALAGIGLALLTRVTSHQPNPPAAAAGSDSMPTPSATRNESLARHRTLNADVHAVDTRPDDHALARRDPTGASAHEAANASSPSTTSGDVEPSAADEAAPKRASQANRTVD
jgi:hypothetical protein